MSFFFLLNPKRRRGKGLDGRTVFDESYYDDLVKKEREHTRVEREEKAREKKRAEEAVKRRRVLEAKRAARRRRKTLGRIFKKLTPSERIDVLKKELRELKHPLLGREFLHSLIKYEDLIEEPEVEAWVGDMYDHYSPEDLLNIRPSLEEFPTSVSPYKEPEITEEDQFLMDVARGNRDNKMVAVVEAKSDFEVIKVFLKDSMTEEELQLLEDFDDFETLRTEGKAPWGKKYR